MENPEYIWFLMSRNLSGEASLTEKEELMDLLSRQPEQMQQYELLRRIWKTEKDKRNETVEDERISHILQLSAVEDAMKEKPEIPAGSVHINRKFKKIYQWAAVLIGILVSVWAVNKWIIQPDTSDANEIIAQKGSRTRTILPDGSTVWLNAGSRIAYEPAFNNTTREITLYGEAFFDVIKETHRPFIVHAGGIDIKVLGTAFNVKSYPDDKTVETTLLRGLVQITRINGKQALIYLRPNQKIVLPLEASGDEDPALINADKTVPLEKTGKNSTSFITYLDSNLKENEHPETSWVYNRLQFRGDSFTELAKKLERWYNITIYFEDEKVKQLTFNGSLENETVEQAFHALKTAVHFNFKIKGNEIFIRSSGEPLP